MLAPLYLRHFADIAAISSPLLRWLFALAEMVISLRYFSLLLILRAAIIFTA